MKAGPVRWSDVRAFVMAAAVLAIGTAALRIATAAPGQLDQRAFSGSLEHPAIEYATRPVQDRVFALSRAIDSGARQLKFERAGGYLRSVLDALDVPIASQVVVFSKTSLQSPRITPDNPRTIFFNDSVAVAWVRGGFMELAALDPRQGMIFYTLDQRPSAAPQLQRQLGCLSCHESFSSLDVAGMLGKSVFPLPDGAAMYQFGSTIPDHRTPFADRWGGWFVTGGDGLRHLGNGVLADPISPPADDSPRERPVAIHLDTTAYLSPYSDVVALMVFDHQRRMTNLLIRLGWEFRVAAAEPRSASATDARGDPAASSPASAGTSAIQEMVDELVDYLLFVDEAPLPARIGGTSGFAAEFSARGPRDRRGRSLRQLDLDRRLLQYPCSYMIYSDAFDALPAPLKDAIYARMWRILSGTQRGKAYARLARADRQAIVEILRDTKPGLPADFQGSIR
jgi:hypothetical protein